MFEETIKKAGQLPTTIVGALLGLVGSAQEPLSVAWFLRLSAPSSSSSSTSSM